jgi:hypothetical protein
MNSSSPNAKSCNESEDEFNNDPRNNLPFKSISSVDHISSAPNKEGVSKRRGPKSRQSLKSTG